MSPDSILLRLLTIVADAAEGGARLNHLAVMQAVKMLQDGFGNPMSVNRTKDGNVVAQWSDGRTIEIGPSWCVVNQTERMPL